MRVLCEGPPKVMEHDGRPYYLEGPILVPVAACSCRARRRDPKCIVPSHRAAAKDQQKLSGRRLGIWMERRLAAATAGPALVCGCSTAQEPA